jgi:hypothetical protein
MKNNPINWSVVRQRITPRGPTIALLLYLAVFAIIEYKGISSRFQPPVYNWLTVLEKAPGRDDYGNTGYWIKIHNSKDATITFRHMKDNNPLLPESWKVGHKYREAEPINRWPIEGIIIITFLMVLFSIPFFAMWVDQ